MKFTATAALALIVACSSSSALAGPPAAANPLLHAHNSERRMLGAAPLMWDARLAAASDAYALHLARSGRWGHSPAHQRVGQGENLWMGTRGAFTPQAMVGDWLSERRMFRAGVFPNVSRSGSWHDVGHYTQIVWPGTTRVGCSVRSSAHWDYLVCRYATPGNTMGQRVGPTRVASR